MAKLIDYNNTGVETGGGGTGVKPPLGLRVCRVAICEVRDKKTNGDPINDVKFALDFGPEYDWVFTYISPDTDWKWAEMCRALKLPEKGKFDATKQVGKLMRVKVDSGQYEGEYSPRAGKMLPAMPGDMVGGASQTSQAAGKPNVPEDTGEPAAGDFIPSRETDPDIGSYDEWEEDDLLAEVEDRGLALAGGRGSKRDKAIASLRSDDKEDDNDEGEQPGDGSEDYSDWDLDALKKEYEDRALDATVPSFRGKGASDRTAQAYRDILIEDDSADPFSS